MNTRGLSYRLTCGLGCLLGCCLSIEWLLWMGQEESQKHLSQIKHLLSIPRKGLMGSRLNIWKPWQAWPWGRAPGEGV